MDTTIGGEWRARDGGAACVVDGTVGGWAESPVLSYASFGTRAAAAVIDVVILQMATMGIDGLILGKVLQSPTEGNLLLATIGPLIAGGAFALFYTVWLECSSWQATLGKRMMGIKVVDLEGRRIGFGKSSWRNMAKGLSALSLGVGYLMPLWDHRRQALHDKATGCLVVREVGLASAPA